MVSSKINLCSICKHCRSLNYCEVKHKFGNDNKYQCDKLVYKHDIYRILHLKNKAAENMHKLDLEFIVEALEKINDQTFDSPHRGRMIVGLLNDIENNIKKLNQ